jgi:hypothetical protein
VRTEKEVREEILKESIETIRGWLIDNLDIADSMHDALRTEFYAHKINELDGIVDFYVKVDMEIESEAGEVE